MAEQGENQRKVAVVTTFIAYFLIVVLGFTFISAEGLAFNDDIFRIFIIYTIIGSLFPTYSVIVLVSKNSIFKSLVYRPYQSLIYFFYQTNKKSVISRFLWDVTRNFILCFLFFQIFFIIIAFFGAILVPQSTLPFFQRYIFPVRPQQIFGIEANKFFFTLFPSPSENGVLTMLQSIVFSLGIYGFGKIFRKSKAPYYLTFVLIVFISAIFWFTIHQTVSSGRELDRIGHTFFGTEIGILTVLTGQWTPGLALHNANLFFWYMRDSLASNEFFRLTLFWSSLITISLFIVFAYIYFRRKK